MSTYMDDLKNIVSVQGKDPRKVIHRENESQPEILSEEAPVEEEVKDTDK